MLAVMRPDMQKIYLKITHMIPSINLADYKFLSNDHTRIENGRPTNANNKGAWRGIRIKTSDNNTFFVSMYNMNENHPVWGDNIQMAEKRMKIVEDTSNKIVLRGFGTDTMGASFADYGLTIHKSNSEVVKVTLHMLDRKIDIVYEKAENTEQSETLDQFSDFYNFKEFINKWNISMSRNEKIQIAIQTDALNNQGVDSYEAGDLMGAIRYYEQALAVMPINDDALKNLRVCYSKIGDHSKVREIEKKLSYLS
jgi:tetratricopeptide (TPR) repeat protein